MLGGAGSEDGCKKRKAMAKKAADSSGQSLRGRMQGIDSRLKMVAEGYPRKKHVDGMDVC